MDGKPMGAGVAFASLCVFVSSVDDSPILTHPSEYFFFFFASTRAISFDRIELRHWVFNWVVRTRVGPLGDRVVENRRHSMAWPYSVLIFSFPTIFIFFFFFSSILFYQGRLWKASQKDWQDRVRERFEGEVKKDDGGGKLQKKKGKERENVCERAADRQTGGDRGRSL
ncbi:hypothetical protein BGZ63DRAFT_200182 [Mariannaea sp. PMI_226]|nr:hypothetical protein BGZ63DRAFT_200182 [Mariannaea sp. PMI_226]